MAPPTILAFDTAGDACSVALLVNDMILTAESEHMPRGQSEALMPMIARVMAPLAVDFTRLDAIAVTRGPGSFTGVRIGLAAAYALSDASGVALVGLSSFEVLAAQTLLQQRAGHQIVVAIESKRTDFYLARYDHQLYPLGDFTTMTSTMLAQQYYDSPILVCGSAGASAVEALQPCHQVVHDTKTRDVDPETLARLAACKFKAGGETRLSSPIYIRPPDVSLSASQSAL